MALEKLTVATLDGGRALREFDRIVAHNTADLLTRSGIEGPRKATLTVIQETKVDPVTGELMPIVSYGITSTTPGVKSPKLTGQILNGTVMLPGDLRVQQARLLDGIELSEK